MNKTKKSDNKNDKLKRRKSLRFYFCFFFIFVFVLSKINFYPLKIENFFFFLLFSLVYWKLVNAVNDNDQKMMDSRID